MHAQQQRSRGGNPVAGDRWIDVAWRQRASILAPAFAGLVLSVVGAFLWPDTFRSTASLRIQSTDPTTQTDYLRKVTSDVESRRALQTIVATYDLYPNDRQRLPLEDVIENMKQQIHVSGVERTSGTKLNVGFVRLSFDYNDRFKAQKVLRELVARFLGSDQPQTGAAPGGNLNQSQDLKDQVDSATKALEAASVKLDDYRAAHQGLLPDQADSNQQKMTELETHRTRVQTGLSRIRSEQSALETQLASEQEKRRSIKEFVEVPAPPRPENKQVTELNRQIQAVEARIRTLKEQYTEKFPDVIDARQKLIALQTQRDALVKEDAAIAPAAPTRKADPEAQRAGAEIDSNIRNLQTQLAAKTTEIGDLTKESGEVEDDIQAMLARFKDLPTGVKEYAELLSERDLKQAQLDEATIKAGAVQKGAPAAGDTRPLNTFEQLDAVTLPEAPISPNRSLIIGGGTLMGLLLGLVIAGTREIKLLDTKVNEPAPIYRADWNTGLVEAPSKSHWLVWSLAVGAGIAAMGWAVAHYYLAIGTL